MTNQAKVNGLQKRLLAAETIYNSVRQSVIDLGDELNVDPGLMAALESLSDLTYQAMEAFHISAAAAANSLTDVSVQSGGQDKDPVGGGGD